MMQYDFKSIDPVVLPIARKSAWNIESMEAHNASDRSVEYIGSQISGFLDNDSQKGQFIFDNYQDNLGEYWFENRALLPNGKIVSMEFYIFGREKNYKKKKRK